MRIHLGKPREPMLVTRNYPQYDLSGKRFDKPALEVVWMLGVSWHQSGGFVFIGIKRFSKWGHPK